MLNSTIKISIIIPIYNTERYLNKCLMSVLNQTYTNLEVICINDGSTDNSLTILNSIKDNRIKIINIDNHGVGYARNLGIDKASGEFILFVDSDDYIESDCCEKLLISQIENSSDIVYCGHFTRTFDGRLQKKWLPSLYLSKQPLVDRYKLTKYLVVTKKLFKTSIIKDNCIKFDTQLNYAEDSLFLTQYLVFCKSASGVKQCLYTDVINPKSLCRNHEYKERRKKDLAISFTKIDKIIKENTKPITTSHHNTIIKRSNKYF